MPASPSLQLPTPTALKPTITRTAAAGYADLLVCRGDDALAFILTTHARSRMHQRCISEHAVASVLTYGRCLHARGATIYAIGKKEVATFANFGIDLTDYSGYQVVSSPEDVILTVYRNHNFRKIRKTHGRRSGYNRHNALRTQGAHA